MARFRHQPNKREVIGRLAEDPHAAVAYVDHVVYLTIGNTACSSGHGTKVHQTS